MEPASGLCLDQYGVARATCRVPARPTREIQYRHVGRARRPHDLRVVAAWSSQNGFRQLSVARHMSEWRVNSTERRLRPEPGALQTHGVEEAQDNEFFPSLPTDPFEHRTGQHVAHVGIGELLTRLRLQGLRD